MLPSHITWNHPQKPQPSPSVSEVASGIAAGGDAAPLGILQLPRRQVTGRATAVRRPKLKVQSLPSVSTRKTRRLLSQGEALGCAGTQLQGLEILCLNISAECKIRVGIFPIGLFKK